MNRLSDEIELNILLGIVPGERWPRPHIAGPPPEEGRPFCMVEVDTQTGEIKFSEVQHVQS